MINLTMSRNTASTRPDGLGLLVRQLKGGGKSVKEMLFDYHLINVPFRLRAVIFVQKEKLHLNISNVQPVF